MNYIKYYEYKELIFKALNDYILKYDLSYDKRNEYGLDIKNNFVSISISYRYKELQILFNNGKVTKELNDFIFEKYPNYIVLTRNNPEFIIFKKQNANENVYEEFSNYLKQAFDFIQEYFPEVFLGRLV